MKVKKFVIFINILFLFGCSNSSYDNGTNLSINKTQKVYKDNGTNNNFSNKKVSLDNGTNILFDDGTNNKKIILKKENVKPKKNIKSNFIVQKKNTSKTNPTIKKTSITKSEPKQSIKKGEIQAKEIVKNTSSPKLTLKNTNFYYPLDKVNISEDFNDTNKGLTFKVNKNSAVFPAAKGMVIFSGNKNGIGKTLFIYHNDGYISIYYNLKTLNVAKGDYIKNLDSSIAYADSSFHFELRKQTKKGIESLNPKNFLQKRRK